MLPIGCRQKRKDERDVFVFRIDALGELGLDGCFLAIALQKKRSQVESQGFLVQGIKE